MTKTTLKVADGLAVSLDYTLRLDDGEVVDSSEDQEPLEYLQGHGQIIRGLEQALYGMAVGEEKEVVVEPGEGYGEVNPDEFTLVPQEAFPSDMEITPGMHVTMRDTNTGELLEAYVDDIRPDGVLLDFNHPLAGETLYFQVRIADLRPASQEEVAHGHVHPDGNEP